MSSHRLQSNIIVGTDPTSSDIEEDNLNENLNEFERNILIDEELNINNSKYISSDFRIATSMPRDANETSATYDDSGKHKHKNQKFEKINIRVVLFINVAENSTSRK